MRTSKKGSLAYGWRSQTQPLFGCYASAISSRIVLIGREKKEKTIKRHTKLRSAVYSNSLAMNNQKEGVITTRIDSMTFLFHFLNTVMINLCQLSSTFDKHGDLILFVYCLLQVVYCILHTLLLLVTLFEECLIILLHLNSNLSKSMRFGLTD